MAANHLGADLSKSVVWCTVERPAAFTAMTGQKPGLQAGKQSTLTVSSLSNFPKQFIKPAEIYWLCEIADDSLLSC